MRVFLGDWDQGIRLESAARTRKLKLGSGVINDHDGYPSSRLGHGQHVTSLRWSGGEISTDPVLHRFSPEGFNICHSNTRHPQFRDLLANGVT